MVSLSEGAYAPTLEGLDVDQVLLFLRLWKKYETELQEWCNINGKEFKFVEVVNEE